MEAMSSQARRVTVLHSLPVWLPQTERWNYDQIVHLPEWIESHIVAETAMNLTQFPVFNLRCLSDSSILRRYWDKLLIKISVRDYLGMLSVEARRTDSMILHSHFGYVAWANRKAAQRLGIRHIASFYGVDASRLPASDPRWRTRYRDLFRRVDLVLCEGPHMAHCIGDLGCPEEKLIVHHLGVCVPDIPFRPRVWSPEEPLRVLIAASFREKKGIPYALAALGVLLREVPLELTIIGDAIADPRDQAEKAQIMEALTTYNLAPHTRLLGYCSNNVLMQEAYAHHVFVSPSITASDGDTEGGAPIGILQMAASGMPIVSTRHCDIPNILPSSADLAEERDVPGLVNQLKWLVENSGSWNSRLIDARQHVATNFNACRQGLRLAEIYAEVSGTPLLEWQRSEALTSHLQVPDNA